MTEDEKVALDVAFRLSAGGLTAAAEDDVTDIGMFSGKNSGKGEAMRWVEIPLGNRESAREHCRGAPSSFSRGRRPAAFYLC